MSCPIDGEVLVITEPKGVEIDDCPQCRGVWLKRGELQKIIDRSAAAPPPRSDPGHEHRGHDDCGHDDRGHGDRDDRPRKKRKDSCLGELFDF